MTLKLSSLAADLDRERDGDWIDIPDLLDVALKVRSLHFPEYRIAYDQMIASPMTR